MFHYFLYYLALYHKTSLDKQCCMTCDYKFQKYYSIDERENHCGESCIEPPFYKLFKVFEPGLLPAPVTNTSVCGSVGYPYYNSTVTHGIWPLSITVDLYDRENHLNRNTQHY